MSKEKLTNPVNSSVEKALEPQRKNKLYTVNGTTAKKEDIAAIVKGGCDNLFRALNRPKASRDNLNQIKERTAEYYMSCMESGRIPTMEGLAVALGIGRATLYKWINETEYPAITEFLTIVRDSFAGISAEAAMGNKINPVTWIFYSKNMYGYVDKTELTVAPANPLGDTKDPAEIQARLMEGIAEED
jgi:hypothetical protein